MGYAIYSQDAKEHEEVKFYIESDCLFDEDFFKDTEVKWWKRFHMA